MNVSFEVSDEIARLYPGHKTALFGPLKMVDRVETTVIRELLTRCQTEWSPDRLISDATIQSWRAAYAKMGASPKKVCSVEYLAQKFIESGKEKIPHPPIEMVALYNAISLATVTPMAAYTVSGIQGAVKLRIAAKGEQFVPLGLPTQIEKTKNGEVVYADDVQVICRYWNMGDCDATKLTPETTDVVLFADLLASTDEEAHTRATEIGELLARGLSAVQAEIKISLY